MDQKPVEKLEAELIAKMIHADELCEMVVDMIGFSPDDELLRNMAISSLKRDLKRNAVAHTWLHASEAELGELQDFLNRRFKDTEWMSHEDLMIEFVLSKPELKSKVFEGLADFCKKFVENFRKV